MTDKEYQHALDVMEKGIRADERAKTIEEFVKAIERDMPYDICNEQEAIDAVHQIAKAFNKFGEYDEGQEKLSNQALVNERKRILEKADNLYACCCEEYGADCFEAQSDAFGEFVVWLMKEIKGGETVNYDCISKSRLVRQIFEIDDILICPSALDRILNLIQNQVPYNEIDYK